MYLKFIADLYPQPYLVIGSPSAVKAVDLLTHDATLIMDGPGVSGLAIDIKDKKLYFGDGNGSISKANLDGSGREVILKNAMVREMTIDWIGRRIFWIKYHRSQQKRIFVVNTEGKHYRTLINTPDFPYGGIAVDPLAG